VPWGYEFETAALKALLKLSVPAQQEIVRYMKERVTTGDPRRFGKPLLRELKGLWRWRVGDYRILGKIVDERLIVLVVDVGHRSNVYD
jgi:mRNA interferase RelE/StbE